MKKYIAVFLLTLFTVTMVACGSGVSDTGSRSEPMVKFTGSKLYTVEGDKILQDGTEVPGASANDFKVVYEDEEAYKAYAVSSTAVYNLSSVIEGVSPTGFMMLDPENDLYKNNEHVYYADTILEGMDAMTYRYLGDYMAADKNGVYSSFSSKWKEVVDPATFEIIPYAGGGNKYGKDSKNVYMDGYIVEGADLKTFDPNKK